MTAVVETLEVAGSVAFTNTTRTELRVDPVKPTIYIASGMDQTGILQMMATDPTAILRMLAVPMMWRSRPVNHAPSI